MVLSKHFDIVRSWEQGEPLSCDLFNFVMENVLRKAEGRLNDTILQKCVQLLADTNDIDIVDSTNREVIAAFSVIEQESTS